MDYLHWMLHQIESVDHDMSRITEAAEVAALHYLKGWEIGVRGGAGLNDEFGGRAGGLIHYAGEVGSPGDLIIYAFGVQKYDTEDLATLLREEFNDAEELKSSGSTIIGIASFAQLDEQGVLDRAKAVCDRLLDNHAPSTNFNLSKDDTHQIMPTMTTANAVMLWTWFGEFFAACSRHGHTPTVYASHFIEGAKQRTQKYRTIRFHDDLVVPPVEAGKLGHRYLQSISDNLVAIKNNEWPEITRAANSCAATIQRGGKVYIAAYGHYPPHHHGGQLAADPNLFSRLNIANADYQNAPIPTADDRVIVIGYCWGPRADEYWGPLNEFCKHAGGTIWVIAGHDVSREDISLPDLLIDQRWKPGDAAVEVEGYDIRICPPSGVISESLIWIIMAETKATILAPQMSDPIWPDAE